MIADPFSSAVRVALAEHEDVLRDAVRKLVPNPKSQVLLVNRTSRPPRIEGCGRSACEACRCECWISPSSVPDIFFSTVLCTDCLGPALDRLIAHHMPELLSDAAARRR